MSFSTRRAFTALLPTIALLASCEAVARLGAAASNPERLALARPLPVEEIGGVPYVVGRPGENRAFAVPADKGDSLRVLVLGGSSVYGWPYSQETAFPARLEERLRRAWKRGPLPVVINGGACGDRTEEILGRLEGADALGADWLVVYAGHNDYSDRFRAMRDAAPAPAAADLARALGASAAYRVWEALLLSRREAWKFWMNEPLGAADKLAEIWRVALARAAADALRPAPSRARGEARREEIVARTTAIYERNLTAVVREARRRGMEVILATPVSNLRDEAPRSSAHLGAPLPPESEAAFGRRLAEAEEAAARSDPAAAEREWREALRIDPAWAAAHYGLGKALAAQGRQREATEAFRAAKDLDLNPQRAHSRIAEAMRRVARREGAELLDLEASFAARPKRQGAAYFNDAIHPSPALHRHIAKRLAARLAPRLWGPPRS